MKLPLFFTLTLCFTTLCSAQPAAFWASSPVTSGETALVYGGNFTPDAVVIVESTPFGETCEVKPVYASATCVMFPWPEEIGDGEALVSIRTPEGETKPLEVNRRRVWWIQGDQGRTATAETGWIRLVSPDDSMRWVNVQLHLASDPKAPKIEYPKAILSNELPLSDVKQSGNYTVLVGGRPVGTITIRSEKEQNFIHDGTFRLTDFGAIPNDGIDDTPAFLAAVEALRANGGGTLLIPSGRFQMNETLELPPHSALVGEADILSLWDPWESGNLCGAQIYWPDRSEPLECLVHGTHDFAVESVTLTCGNHRDGISNQLTPEQKAAQEAAQEAGQKVEPQKNVRIRNVTLRMIYSEYANAAMDETVRRLNPLHYARALRLCGENVQVWRNDVYCQAGGVFEIKCRWSSFTENRFSRGNIVGWNGFGGQQIIFAENHLGGANCTSFYGLPEGSENILWLKNTHEQNFDGNNRETITGDLRVHGYIDRVESITPTGFNLLKEIQAERGGGTLQGEKVLDRGISTWYKPENEPQLNGMVQLAAGTGAGQMRRIREIKTLEDGTIHVEVDRPWEILPDEETVVVIASFRRHFILRENEFHDSTVAFQCYGSLLESVIQENHSFGTGGINADSMSWEPSWFNQYLENHINGSGVLRGPRNEVPATNAQFGVLNYGNGTKSFQYPMLRGCVVRDNFLIHSAKLNVMGPVCEAIIERNSIVNSPIGITVDPAARGIFLRENEMVNVQRPYDFAPESVISDPVEIFRVNVLAVSERPDGTFSLTLPETISPDALDSLRAQVIREFAALCDKEKRAVTPLEAELLTGVKLDFPNWQTTWHVLQNGEAGTNPLYIQVRNPLVAATLQMRVKPEDVPLEGWTFELPEFRLEPGKAVAENMKITKPEGFGALVPIPITGTLTAADGSWTLEFTTRAINPWAEATPKDWLVSAPMENPNPTTRPAGIGYMKYEDLPKVAADQLTAQTAQDKKLTLIPAEADANAQAAADGQVVYAVTTITAKNPARIGLKSWSQGALVFVNGRLIGTNQARGQWGFAPLQEGENRIECWIYVSKRNQFQFKVPSITWASEAF